MDRIQKDFEKWIELNPHVYEVFNDITQELIRLGYTHSGAALVWEVMRWKLNVETVTDDPVKLNNNYRSRLVRLWEDRHPEHQGFFHKRKLAEHSVNSTQIDMFDDLDRY